jgi:hypothetical protein
MLNNYLTYGVQVPFKKVDYRLIHNKFINKEIVSPYAISENQLAEVKDELHLFALSTCNTNMITEREGL